MTLKLRRTQRTRRMWWPRMPQKGERIVLRGCVWDEHWEYDCPSILYFPFKSYSSSAYDSFAVDDMAERAISNLLDGRESGRWDKGDLEEFRWRRWSVRGFSRRKSARHVELLIEFYVDKERPGLSWRTIRRKERFGPFPKRAPGWSHCWVEASEMKGAKNAKKNLAVLRALRVLRGEKEGET